MTISTSTKMGYACFIGAPNAGKSTIFNKLLNQNLSGVTHKAHTTRDIINGIITINKTQLVLIDTPGYLEEPRYKLEKLISKKCIQAMKITNFVCIVIDIAKKNCLENSLFYNIDSHLNKDTILLFNKIDLVHNKSMLLSLAKQAKDKGFNNIFMISGIHNKGTGDFLNYLLKNAPQGKWHYKESVFTNRSNKKIMEDITMEQLYKFLNKELPYNLKVDTDRIVENTECTTVHQVITVTKNSQKKIILGCKGDNIKKIGVISKKKIEMLLGKKVHLFLFIKIDKDCMGYI